MAAHSMSLHAIKEGAAGVSEEIQSGLPLARRAIDLHPENLLQGSHLPPNLTPNLFATNHPQSKSLTFNPPSANIEIWLGQFRSPSTKTALETAPTPFQCVFKS